MLKNVIFRILGLTLLLFFITPSSKVPAMPLSSANVAFVNPSACPSGGCAAGQHLGLQASFDLNNYLPSTNTNLQFCVYTPINWSADQLVFSPLGELTGSVYIPDFSHCGPEPTGYQVLGGVSANLNDNYFGESISFSLQIGATANQSGSILIREFEFDGNSWAQTEQAFVYVPVAPTGNNVFAAENSLLCSTNSPCYIDSAVDLAGGLGTGLKDAVDAVPAASTITILGNYPIKNQSVVVDKVVTIQGNTYSSITSSGTNCNQALLSIQNAVTIQNLSIDDGNCTNPDRNLLHINSSQPVNLFSNNLTGGNDAVFIDSNNGPVTLRFNNISGNSGYAVFQSAGSGTGLLDVTANNIFNNRTGVQVSCALPGSVNHNYWGYAITPLTAAPGCSFTSGKRLGSPILANSNGSGVQATRVTVTDQKIYYFENNLALQHNQNITNFDVYVVNHGASSSNSPFQSSGVLSNLVPCSNYFDLFLTNPASSGANLDLSIKYNLNAACIANIESTSYCGQTSQSLFPLWWYDPLQLITTGWDTTGQNPTGSESGGVSGQTTACNTTEKEITVQLDNSGRPGLSLDLSDTPFVIGIIGQPAAAVLSAFTVTPSNMQVNITWNTNSELNTSGFYVQRRLTGIGNFERVSPFFQRAGSDTAGAEYTFFDTDVTNFTSYEYRLEIVGSDFMSVYSNILPATPMPPTNTPTITQTPTITNTPTPTITLTPSITLTPTITPTRTPTRTRTRTPTPTRTTYRYRTSTPTRTPTRTATFTPLVTRTSAFSPTVTPTPRITGTVSATSTTNANGYPGPDGTNSVDDGNRYPGPENGTSVNNQTGTISPISSKTPGGSTAFTPTPPKPADDNNQNKNRWIYPVFGGLIGISLLLLVAYFLWKNNLLKIPFIDKFINDRTDRFN